MATVSEMGATFAYIVATLQADTTLMGYAPGGIHPDLAPDETPTPFITVSYITGPDLTTQNKTRYANRNLWLIKGVAEDAKFATLELILSQIDTHFGFLPGGSAQDSRAIYYQGYRVEIVSYPELIEKTLWRHHGGRYSFDTQLK